MPTVVSIDAAAKLRAAYTKYAPKPSDPGYVEFGYVRRAGILERLDRFDPWREMPATVDALKRKAASLSSEWGFTAPSIVIPFLWKGHPLLADVGIVALPAPAIVAAWTPAELPRVHYVALSERDGLPRDFNPLWQTLCHEFLHRVEFERPDAFKSEYHYSARDTDGGHCTRAIQELAPILANLSASTAPYDRDRLNALQRACVTAERNLAT